jgi:chorismate mutase
MTTTTITDTQQATDTQDADAIEQIAVLRGQINALDTAIIRLVAERAALSRRVQAARMNAGGTRVELGREREIMASYRDALGAHGPAVADAILHVCRGRA